jgi:Protein of unknown function (DUF3800)
MVWYSRKRRLLVSFGSAVRSHCIDNRREATVLIAYVDESGSDDANAVIGVGGLISNSEKWAEFESRWTSVMLASEVKYSHMREFAHSVGEFTKWKSSTKGFEPQRRAFLAALCASITNSAAYSFGAILTKSHYEQFVPEDMRKDMGTPYTFLGRYCMARVGVWADNNGVDEPVNIVFEQGQPETALRFQHGILSAHELARKEFRIGQLSFADKRSVLELQAADVVAYELVKHWNDLASSRSNKPRYPLQQLMTLDHDWNKITTIDIAREVEVWKSIRDQARILEHESRLGI